jgi:hypothetical protein
MQSCIRRAQIRRRATPWSARACRLHRARGFPEVTALMLGSRPNEPNPAVQTRGVQLYSVRVLGRTLWGWQRRNAAGDLLACNGHFFPDYVDCLCDSLRF